MPDRAAAVVGVGAGCRKDEVMEARLKCEKPEDIVYTVTLTMTARDWEILRNQLSVQWPSGQLYRAINNLLAQARKVYWPEEETKPEQG